MPYKNRERYLEYQREYNQRKERKKKIRETTSKWRKTKRGREKMREYQERRRMKDPEKIREIKKRSYEKLKREVLSHYSNGKLECACCGERIYKFLTLDHIRGFKNSLDYKECRRKNGKRKANAQIYAWLRKNNFPPGYQVLCYNCNLGAARNGGICPHEEKSLED